MDFLNKKNQPDVFHDVLSKPKHCAHDASNDVPGHQPMFHSIVEYSLADQSFSLFSKESLHECLQISLQNYKTY